MKTIQFYFVCSIISICFTSCKSKNEDRQNSMSFEKSSLSCRYYFEQVTRESECLEESLYTSLAALKSTRAALSALDSAVLYYEKDIYSKDILAPVSSYSDEWKSKSNLKKEYVILLFIFLLSIVILILILQKRHKQFYLQKEKMYEAKEDTIRIRNLMLKKTNIYSKIKMFSLTNPNPQELFRKIRELAYKPLSEEDWNELTTEIDTTFDNFTIRLKKNYTKVTDEDIRFCCLLKIGKSPQDIGLLFNITATSVNKKKYRLKTNKMNLDKNINFDKFLINF